MKIFRFQMPQQMLWLVTTLILTHCVGCLNLIDKILDDADEPPNGDGGNDSWIVTDMPVRDVVVLIAESLPVQVTVEVIGYLPDGCTSQHETHQSIEANTVTIQMTMKRRKARICTKVVTDIRERIHIGTFPPGDYRVIVNGVKRKFRID